MSFPPNPNNPYEKPQQPGYGYPQQPPQPAPGYGYPPAGQSPYADPNAGAYGYPQQPGYPAAPGPAGPNGYAEVPGRGTVLIATYGQRVGARLLDSVIAYVAYWIISAVITGGMFLAASGGDANAAAGAAVGAIVVTMLLLGGIFIFYDVIFVTTMGATPGKKILGLQVIDSRNGQRPSFGSALLRWGFPVGLGLLTCSLGYIAILLSPFFDNSGKLQGWHDKAANTLVIKV